MIRLLEHWEILAGMIASFFAYLGGKKIKQIEEKKAGSDAVASMQTVYDNFVKDMEQRYSDMKEEVLTVKGEVVQLRAENNELRREVVVLRKENAQLRKELQQ